MEGGDCSRADVGDWPLPKFGGGLWFSCPFRKKNGVVRSKAARGKETHCRGWRKIRKMVGSSSSMATVESLRGSKTAKGPRGKIHSRVLSWTGNSTNWIERGYPEDGIGTDWSKDIPKVVGATRVVGRPLRTGREGVGMVENLKTRHENFSRSKLDGLNRKRF